MNPKVLELEREIGEASAQAHAAMARVALAAAEFDELGGLPDGFRTFPDWLAVWAGLDLFTGAELLRVGQALRSLPLLSAAFAAGELSFDKVRQATRVATPATEELMTTLAVMSSGRPRPKNCPNLRLWERRLREPSGVARVPTTTTRCS